MRTGHVALLTMILAAGSGAAHATASTGVDFLVSFTGTNHQVSPGDSFADIMAAHLAGTPISTHHVTALDGITTSLYATGMSGDYSVLMSADLDIATIGNYAFQVGTDWGRGGGVALMKSDTGAILEEFVTSDDIWWEMDFNNPDVITTNYHLDAGKYTIAWVGFEGCCAGSSTVRFAFEGGSFETLNLENIQPYVVPVPSAVYLLGSSLFGLFAASRRKANSERALSA